MTPEQNKRINKMSRPPNRQGNSNHFSYTYSGPPQNHAPGPFFSDNLLDNFGNLDLSGFFGQPSLGGASSGNWPFRENIYAAGGHFPSRFTSSASYSQGQQVPTQMPQKMSQQIPQQMPQQVSQHQNLPQIPNPRSAESQTDFSTDTKSKIFVKVDPMFNPNDVKIKVDKNGHLEIVAEKIEKFNSISVCTSQSCNNYTEQVISNDYLGYKEKEEVSSETSKNEGTNDAVPKEKLLGHKTLSTKMHEIVILPEYLKNEFKLSQVTSNFYDGYLVIEYPLQNPKILVREPDQPPHHQSNAPSISSEENIYESPIVAGRGQNMNEPRPIKMKIQVVD